MTTVPCTLVTDAQIIGRGSSNQEAVLHLPTITGAPGDRIKVPILLQRGGSDLERIGARNFKGELAFNKTMLVDTDRSNESSDTATRRIRFSGTRRDTSGIIAEAATRQRRMSVPSAVDDTSWYCERRHWWQHGIWKSCGDRRQSPSEKSPPVPFRKGTVSKRVQRALTGECPPPTPSPPLRTPKSLKIPHLHPLHFHPCQSDSTRSFGFRKEVLHFGRYSRIFAASIASLFVVAHLPFSSLGRG